MIHETLTYLKGHANPSSILSFDMSLTGTGICHFENGEFNKSKVVKTSTNDGTIRQRLAKIRAAFVKSLTKHKPQVVALEAISVFTNPNSAKVLSMVYGQLLSAATEVVPDALFVSVTTTQIKKVGTGDGKSDKNLVLLGVFQRFGVSLSNDNEADAFCAGVAARDLLRVADNYTFDAENPKFLINYRKGRDKLTQKFLAEAGIDDAIFEVCLSAAGGSGTLTVLKENDYKVYVDTYKRIYDAS